MMPSSLPIRECESLWNPHRLVSLWELMVEHDIIVFADIVRTITCSQVWPFIHGSIPFTHLRNTKLGDPHRKVVRQQTEDIVKFCEAHELSASTTVARRLIDTIDHPVLTPDYEELRTRFESLRDVMQTELSQRKFAYVSHGHEPFFEKGELFGKHTHDAFPSACEDIKAAGNCIAADLHTAAVFHLMRVAELGMRTLASYCKVITVRNNVPIELGTWGNIITEISRELNPTGGRPTTKVKRRKAELFGNRVIRSLTEFRKGWRDDVMHAGDMYNETGAIHAFELVKMFMQELAKFGLSEGTKKRIPAR